MKKRFSKLAGEYFIELSKLVFGGVVLGTVLNLGNIDKIMLILAGFSITLLFVIFGFYLSLKEK